MVEGTPRQGYWGRADGDILADSGGKVPKLLVELGETISTYCTDTEGIFRRTSNVSLAVRLLEYPADSAVYPAWSYCGFARSFDCGSAESALGGDCGRRPIAAAQNPVTILERPPGSAHPPNDVLYHSQLYRNRRVSARDLSTFKANDRIHSVLVPALSPPAKTILEYVVRIMADLSFYESSTKMSALALAIVVAPTLINGDDPLEDAEMCLSPGKTLPVGLRKVREGNDGEESVGKGGTLVGLLKMWIEEVAEQSG